MAKHALDDPFQTELYKLLYDLGLSLRELNDPRKMLIHTLRSAIDGLGAEAGVVAAINTGRITAESVWSIPSSEEWNFGLLNDYIKGRRPALPQDFVIAGIGRRGRTWAALALRLTNHGIERPHVKALWAIAKILTERIEAFDAGRIQLLRRRIEHKVADRQHPKDTIYDILHGIRKLIRYDHSASFFVMKETFEPLELVAEQIAWTKSKSRRIGTKIHLEDDLLKELGDLEVHCFKRIDNSWRDSNSGKESALANAIDLRLEDDTNIPKENAILCALVATPDSSLGVLRIAFQHSAGASEFEAMIVRGFMPLLSLTLQFLHRTATLEDQVIQAERRSTLVRMSRAIAHDINNALGAILPLVQQMRVDTEGKALQQEMLLEDLQVIEDGMQTCRRIFGGMLAFARSFDRQIGAGNLRRAIDSAVNVYQTQLSRQSITFHVHLPQEVSTLQGNQGDLTAVFLNLFSNSIDAMPEGGALNVRAREMGRVVVVEVEDTGLGIPADLLERVTDPWVSTKQSGRGLGLSICRAILWEIDGEMKINSTEGEGTSVRLQIPIDPTVIERSES